MLPVVSNVTTFRGGLDFLDAGAIGRLAERRRR
jgi:hypothetical protein